MKRLAVVLASLLFCAAAGAQQAAVQVVMPESVNLPESEVAWLPGLIQDKFKSNLQEYLGMHTVVDASSEATLKRLQRESEDSGRDENTAIEFGKISTAKFAVMTTIRRTGRGYTISVDYTDMTTGVQKATATSKEYPSAEELYGSTGAIDEITLSLADKLNIAINPIQRQVLEKGAADFSFSIDDQLMLARKNEEQYKKLLDQFDEQLLVLSISNDTDALGKSKKIEAERALLAEKQQSELKRLVELAEQKKQADADAQREAKRSEEQKRRRNELSKQAAAKAAEVRKLKMEAQSALGQISVIESKKKALVEIWQDIKDRIQELHEQAEQDKADNADKIRNEPWRRAELERGVPTEAAQRRREKRIAEYNAQRDATFQKEAERVKTVSTKQEAELLSDIRKDQANITKPKTVSSLGDELKVSYGEYSGANNGWNVYLSLYSESILLYQNTLLVQCKALTGKDAPDIEKAPDSVVNDYMDTVDMYDSLLLRGDPILYFEIDYTVTAAADEFPSKYTFSFQKLRVINTVTGKTVQMEMLSETMDRTMSPAWDIRTEEDIRKKTAEEQKKLADMQKRYEAEQERQAKKQAKHDRMAAQRGYYHTLGGGGLGGMGIDYTHIDADTGINGFDIYLAVAVKTWLFLDFGIKYLEFDYYEANADQFYSSSSSASEADNSLTGLYGGIGLNKRIHLFSWHPALYYLFDAGYLMTTDGTTASKEESDTESSPFFEHSVGLVLPVLGKSGSTSLDVNVCYKRAWYPLIDLKFMDSFSVGVRLTMHPGSL